MEMLTPIDFFKILKSGKFNFLNFNNFIMKITIESKSVNLLIEISKILKEKNNTDKISEVLDLLKRIM